MPVLESEKELEMYLMSLPLDESHPFFYGGEIFQQVQIKGYGTIDMLHIDIDTESFPGNPQIHISIIELKKGKIDFNAIGQLARYKKAIERAVGQCELSHYDCVVNGILVGDSLADGDACFLVDSMSWVSAYTYKISLDTGIEIEDQCGWYNKGEDFNNLPLLTTIREWLKTSRSNLPSDNPDPKPTTVPRNYHSFDDELII